MTNLSRNSNSTNLGFEQNVARHGGFATNKKTVLSSLALTAVTCVFVFALYEGFIFAAKLKAELHRLNQKISSLEEQLVKQALELEIAQEAARAFELKYVKAAVVQPLPQAYMLSEDALMLLFQCAVILAFLGVAGGLTYWGVASLKHAFASTFFGKVLVDLNTLGLKLVGFGSSGDGESATKTFADFFGNEILVETFKSTSLFIIKIKPADSSVFVDLSIFLLKHREMLDSCAVSALTMPDDAAGGAAVNAVLTSAECMAVYLKHFPPG
jgi:hypothetical protein